MQHKALIVEFDLPEEAVRIKEELGKRFPDIQIDVAKSPAEVSRCARHIDVLIGKTPFFTQELVDRLPELAWIQCATSGVDRVLKLRLRSDTIVTSARGIHGPQVSEMAFFHMMSLARSSRRLCAQQEERRWDYVPQLLLYGKTVVVVGVGAIAEALAVRCRAFGMLTVGVTRTIRNTAGFDELLTYREIVPAVTRGDFVILLSPLSEETRGLVSASVIAAMKSGAVFINLGRGACVDEEALAAAVKAGSISVGLDVFQAEPLPPESPWWSLPNTFLTPHLGGASDNFPAQFMEVLVPNFAAFIDGRLKEMKNRVA